MDALLELLRLWLPAAVTLLAVAAILKGSHFLLEKWYGGSLGYQFRLQIIMLVLTFLGLLAVILALPISEAVTGQLLSLIGLLLSAAIALSATTFVGNVMAGLMQRAVRNFRPGDFISVGDHFGRVSEQGLFHVEIQTEERDLTTLPNLYLATNPVKVVRTSGTMVTAEVSLGYDVARTRVKDLLLQAAEMAGLEESFVQVKRLGDFSVTYRVAGLLRDVKNLISTRSRLREMMLDQLHGAGIEIVSPNFMNQRLLEAAKLFLPATVHADDDEIVSPESVVFDKAEAAESIEKLKWRYEERAEEVKALEDELKEMMNAGEKARMEERLASLKRRQETLAAEIARRQEEHD